MPMPTPSAFSRFSKMASNSENIVEELIEVEVLLDQDVLNLLKSFNLSDQAIEQFLSKC